MLGIRRVGRDGADYYLADLARELPVAQPGHWAGGAASGLGVRGPVEPGHFRALLEGRPVTGRPLGSGRTTVAAFDLTFSAPKSASVLFALGGDDVARRIVGVHTEAVAGALAYLERHGVTAVRRSGPEQAVIATSGVAAAVFTHGVNRNLDPHLHSHVVMANLVHGADGRWGACDHRGLWAHRAAGGAVYDAHLRAGLAAELGVRWSGPDIEGMAPQLLGEFSSRSADIRRHAFEHGARSALGRHVAWAATRPDKVAGTPFRALAPEWGRRAEATGGAVDVAALTRPGRAWDGSARGAVVRGGVVDEHRYAGAIALTPHGGAHRRDVVTAFGAGTAQGAEASTLERLTDEWAPEPGVGVGVGVGVAETLHSRAAVVPGNHLQRTLGPRPVDPAAHGVWMDAAKAIDRYRARWGVERSSEEPLGASPLAALPADRLADHVRTTRRIDEARLRLGWREPRQAELGLGLDLGR
jgi:conjugative relaxase-like TrwC/TraI family protein